jgi:hypothetical protein
MRKILTWALWIFLILAVIAVAYFAWTRLISPPDEPAPEIVTLVCSNECAGRGQCGTAQGDGEKPVVLAGKDGPVVEPNQHDVFFISGSSVEVKDSMEVMLVEVEGGENFPQTFSRVEWVNPMGDIVQTGWVAEWCIERQ